MRNGPELDQIVKILGSFSIKITTAELIKRLVGLAPKLIQIEADLIILEIQTHLTDRVDISLIGR
jgi:hypothetical protein